MNIKSVITTLILLASTNSFADAPLPPPAGKRFCDYRINYCGYTDPKTGTNIYKVDGSFKLTKLYHLNGWFRAPYLSPNGIYFVAGYAGLNLVPQNVTPHQVMLNIYKNGKPHKAIPLGNLMANMNNLKKTVSHYHWGSVQSVDNYSVNLVTVEGKVSVSLETGLVSR